MDAKHDPLAGLAVDERLTIPEAARRLGINHVLIRKAIRNGTLRAHLPPGVRRDAPGRAFYTIHTTDLRDWWLGGYTR